MEPITLGVITAAVTALAWEVAKGSAGEAGKTAWQKIKNWIGCGEQPPFEQIAPSVAGKLAAEPLTAKEVVAALQASGPALAARIASVIDPDTLKLTQAGRDAYQFAAKTMRFEGIQKFGG